VPETQESYGTIMAILRMGEAQAEQSGQVYGMPQAMAQYVKSFPENSA